MVRASAFTSHSVHKSTRGGRAIPKSTRRGRAIPKSARRGRTVSSGGAKYSSRGSRPYSGRACVTPVICNEPDMSMLSVIDTSTVYCVYCSVQN